MFLPALRSRDVARPLPKLDHPSRCRLGAPVGPTRKSDQDSRHGEDEAWRQEVNDHGPPKGVACTNRQEQEPAQSLDSSTLQRLLHLCEDFIVQLFDDLATQAEPLRPGTANDAPQPASAQLTGEFRTDRTRPRKRPLPPRPHDHRSSQTGVHRGRKPRCAPHPPQGRAVSEQESRGTSS